MSEPFVAEIKIISWNFAPKGWAFCNGQLLPINQNQALFSLLGTTYGGDGRVNFALPDLRGRIPTHMGSGMTLGERSGAAAHTLISSELPAHSHSLIATSAAATTGDPVNAGAQTFAKGASAIYAEPTTLIPMDSHMIDPIGGSQPHSNMMPYLVLNFCIALQGIFPSQN